MLNKDQKWSAITQKSNSITTLLWPKSRLCNSYPAEYPNHQIQYLFCNLFTLYIEEQAPSSVTFIVYFMRNFVRTSWERRVTARVNIGPYNFIVKFLVALVLFPNKVVAAIRFYTYVSVMFIFVISLCVALPIYNGK